MMGRTAPAFSPKGWESSAQGTALGMRPTQPDKSSPKGWERLSQPFGLEPMVGGPTPAQSVALG